MVSTYFDDYDKKFPGVIIEILEYSEISNRESGSIKDRSILKFCERGKTEGNLVYQPQIISRICKRLCDCGQLECLQSRGGIGLSDNYLSVLNRTDLFKENKEKLQYYYNSMVYGFEYIYNMYRSIVIPIVWDWGNGNYAMGTGFKFSNGIVTAKHCITDVKNLQIKGYMASELEGKPIYVSDKDGVDIAFIETGRVENPQIFIDVGEVMQEVLVMGYPKIPAFTDFLTAEKAIISSKASSRITPTKGNIAAYGYEYLTSIDAMLITAKIKGGNSGGPVINQNGCLVGVACQIPAYDKVSDYDDLGYGIAVPAKYLTDILERKPKQLDVSANFYRDFSE